MEKQSRTKKDIVKMLLKNKELENEDEEQLMEILFNEPIAIDVDKQAEESETWSDKLADKITEVAGSWSFIIIFVIILIICFICEIGYIIESKEKNGKNLLFASLVPTVMETVIGFTILIIFLEQRKMKRYITCSNDSAINFLNNRLITRLNLYQSLCVSYFSLIFVPLGLAVLYCWFERIKCKKTQNKEIINEKMLIEKEEQTTKGECTSELSRNSSENIIN